MTKPLYYLGPQGSFTHQAAASAAEWLADEPLRIGRSPELVAVSDVPAIMSAVERDEAWGVVAWENNVEGYVVPNLDLLIDSHDTVGFARIVVDIAFDAFTRGKGVVYEGARVSAHPHGLAQCKAFIAEHRLTAVPASSNAAACRDLETGQMALGPSICGPLYGLTTVAQSVQDYSGAHTEFLVLAPRDEGRRLLERARESGVDEFETIITFIPLSTGPGVLANLLDVVRDAGLNMTSFISRPIKGHDGTYSFIVTLDAAPWQPRFRAVLEEIVDHGDWVKTLAVYPRRERPNPPVDAWMLPEGGVHVEEGALHAAGVEQANKLERELLW